MTYIIDSDLNLIPKKNKPWGKLIIIALTILCAYLLIGVVTDTPAFKIIYKEIKPAEQKDIELSDSAIVKCLHDNGCVLPNIALAQAKLESNVGKSNVGKNAKNMFGITYHNCKYVDGKHGAYAKYKTYEDNIKCYIHIQDSYLKNINGKYATDPNYVQAIKNVK
jgi:flagellum-specific peptidoglycan hydrolase FlgJ